MNEPSIYKNYWVRDVTPEIESIEMCLTERDAASSRDSLEVVVNNFNRALNLFRFFSTISMDLWGWESRCHLDQARSNNQFQSSANMCLEGTTTIRIGKL